MAYAPPVQPPWRIGDGFHVRRTPTHMHQGVDIPGPLGSPVYAVADGIVEHAHSAVTSGFHGYGNVVVLRHPGEENPTWTLYAHLDKVLVFRGQEVTAGQQIGEMGRTRYARGDSSDVRRMGVHLHFEVSKHAYPQPSEVNRVDPVPWLKARGVHAPNPRRAPSVLLVAAADWGWYLPSWLWLSSQVAAEGADCE